MMRASSNRKSPLQAGHTRMALSSSSIMPASSGGSCARRSCRPPQELAAEPREGRAQPLLDVDARLPTEEGAGPRDVRLAHLGVVLGQGLEDDLAGGAG